MRLEFHSPNKSVKYCGDICDGVKSLTTNVKELRKETQLLTRTNQERQAENNKLADKMEEVEQYQRSHNLEIEGVQMEADPLITVILMGEKIGEEIRETDIDI